MSTTSAAMETLSRKLEETHREAAAVRGEVVEALRCFYAQAPGLSAGDAVRVASAWAADAVGPSELQQTLRRLEAELLEAADGLQAGGEAPQAALVASLAQRDQLHRQLQQSRAMVVLVERLTDADRRLGEVHLATELRRFAAAADGVVAVEKLAAELPADEECDVSRAMRLQTARARSHLQSQMRQFYACAVVWGDGSLELVANEGQGGGRELREELRDFWKACGALDLLAPRLKDVAKAVALRLVKPALQLPNAAVERVGGGGDRAGLVVRQGEPGRDANGGEADAQCANVVAILLFAHAELFAGSAELMNRLGDVLWKIPGNLEAMLLGLLRDKIPQDAKALSAYRDALTLTVTELENKLVAVGFSACSNSQLREFVSQLNQLHSKKRREHVLRTARDQMRRGYNDSVRINGPKEKCSLPGSSAPAKKGKGGAKAGPVATNAGLDDAEAGYFDMPNYRVSVVARDAVEAAHKTLAEACAAEPMSAKLLFQTSRDLLFLFRAVVPTLYADAIANDARAAMLFHNDCQYMAHHMLTIGLLYKQRLPPPLNQTATMIDMVPTFRNAGERALVSFAASQTDDLLAAAASLPPLRDVASDRAADQVEDFFKGVLHKLGLVSSSWKEGLPPAVYRKVTAKMLEPLVAKFVAAVLAEQKISANAGAHLHHLLSLLLECESLFDSSAQGDTHVGSLVRLRKLTALLADPISTVRDKVRSSSLAEFSRGELLRLAKSLYRESPEQQALLHEITEA